MSKSANSLTVRKVTTRHRITVCAQQLTDVHGFDGFTMDELAEAARVSRRTLFNYFPGKLDAVLGTNLAIDAQHLERFRSGGPTGVLLDDLMAIVRHIVDIKEFTTEEAEVARRIIKSDSRLLTTVHHRFEEVADDFAARILEREGPDFGVRRAKLLVTILACLYDFALNDVLEDASGEKELARAYADTLTMLRRLLA